MKCVESRAKSSRKDSLKEKPCALSEYFMRGLILMTCAIVPFIVIDIIIGGFAYSITNSIVLL